MLYGVDGGEEVDYGEEYEGYEEEMGVPEEGEYDEEEQVTGQQYQYQEAVEEVCTDEEQSNGESEINNANGQRNARS